MATNPVDNSYQRVLNALKRKDFNRAEQVCLFDLKEKPLDPQLWVYLGYALLQQGYAESARKLYKRALLLDPQASWIEDSLKSIKGSRHKKIVDRLLQVKPVTVTAGILVRNEERTIERCISSLLEAVDEIVVIDTGSTDKTIEIMKTFPNARLVEFPWCDDFAAARNFGLQHMTSEWVIWVDADEHLHQEDIQTVRTIASLYNETEFPAILKIGQLNQIGDSLFHNYEQARMFPLNKQLCYWGKIHEQIGPTSGDFYTGSFIRKNVRIRLHHDGYDPAVKDSKAKLERNLRLLKQMVEEEPDNPVWLYFYGRETFSNQDIDLSIELLTKAEQKAAQNNWFAPKLSVLKFLIRAYLAKGDLEQAEAACFRAIQIDEQYPDARYYLSQILYKKAIGLFQLAEQHAVKAKESFSTYRNLVSADPSIYDWKADACIADIALYSGNILKAKSMFKSLLDKYPSLEVVTKQNEYIQSVRSELNKSS